MTKYDPVLAMLEAAPIDDEPVTEEDRRYIEMAREDYRNGDVVSAEEIRRACLDANSDTNLAEATQKAAV